MTTTLARTFRGSHPLHEAGRWLQAQGLSQGDVARAVGCFPSIIYGWVRGGAFPLRFFDAIETLLGTEAREEFTRLFGDPKPPVQPLPRARMTAGALWLDSQGLNLIDLARLMDCSTSAISHYLTGRSRPPKNLYRAVQILLGESAAEELRAILQPETRAAV